MGARQYLLGLRHGREGIRALAHRQGRIYDEQSDQRSYLNGYSAGARERYNLGGKVGLDYKNPLNNQLFTDGRKS